MALLILGMKTKRDDTAPFTIMIDMIDDAVRLAVQLG
jgi:hypothetical protein